MSIYLERETEETVVAKNKQISGHGQESDPVHQVWHSSASHTSTSQNPADRLHFERMFVPPSLPVLGLQPFDS